MSINRVDIPRVRWIFKMRQANYWMGTKKFDNEMDMSVMYELNSVESGNGCITYLKGQQELPALGYHHWQFLVHVSPKKSLSQMKEVDRTVHWEPTRSDAAEDYVWKEESSVEGTKFEFGKKAFKRNSKVDWAVQIKLARAGQFEDMDPGVLFRNYTSAKRLYNDTIIASKRDNICVNYYYGRTGTGKTYAAMTEAGEDAYWKLSTNKWWDGYKGQLNVVIDEMTAGCIGICHLLRWFDWYPCQLEVKGSCIGLKATNFWVTSNLSLDELLENEREEHKNALKRRITKVKEFLVRNI